ncbi:MAG: bile acid:sodium symporter family protein [Synergistaceae bacterium]|nr:bile acid:sodium symporter family protein [Synergistaceae bacterium]MBQ3758906.1 bile acid:sodium symporter family protein [Synergistaceae bacterium]MBQ6114857.1 bile acid:sodium symporter family protein [Synergistaceae bacterium]MBQ6418832.1 bile acid:sodium symporter family protein [Synergistaceae bacterium]MBQ6664224.1 bile acid:sodium symporter family protein [Synergistaceae bacterium]
MEFLRKVSSIFGRYMAVIVVAVTLLSLFVPSSSLWIQTSWINPLLMLVMFGMGLTLSIRDFIPVFTHPKYVLLGTVAQFTIMPLLAWGLSIVFGLDTALMAGVVLVGTCPGGTSSNVITYLSRGDVALSVGMTSVNTLLAPFLTPAITYLILRATISVDVVAMFISIVQVVIIPIVLGFAINKLFPKITETLSDILPAVSVTAICLIVACVVSHNSERILSTGWLVFAVVILHNILGYLCGFILGKILGLDTARVKAISIEVGMQNSGLATSLAASTFPNLAMATVPGALFSVWHNISGALLASIYRRWNGDVVSE